MRPRVHWLAANCYMHSNQSSKGLSELRRLLELSSVCSEPAFELCHHLRFGAETVDQQVLPEANEPEIQLAYADFLGGQRRCCACR